MTDRAVLLRQRTLRKDTDEAHIMCVTFIIIIIIMVAYMS